MRISASGQMELRVVVTKEDRRLGEPLWGSDVISRALAHVDDERVGLSCYLEPHPGGNQFDPNCRLRIVAEMDGKRWAVECSRLSAPEACHLLCESALAWSSERYVYGRAIEYVVWLNPEKEGV